MVTHCPAKNMVTDFISKPTQGFLFRQKHNVMLDLKEDDFDMNKAQYEKSLIKFDLWGDQEDDLERTQMVFCMNYNSIMMSIQ